MAKAATKAELITESTTEFQKMWTIIEKIPLEIQEKNFNFPENIGKEAHWLRDKNLRDMLIHIYEWQVLLVKAFEADRDDKTYKFLPEPYNWRTYGEMNLEIRKKHQATSLEEAKRLVKEAHQKILTYIEKLSEQELFEKGHFAWAGNWNIVQYTTSATSGHYRWAQKKSRKIQKYSL